MTRRIMDDIAYAYNLTLRKNLYKEIDIMTINKRQNGTELVVMPEGDLDAITAPELDMVMKEALSGMTSVTLDLEKVMYVSSAGLRVILAVEQIMKKQGTFRLIHVSEIIREIFELTGLTDVLSIE